MFYVIKLGNVFLSAFTKVDDANKYINDNKVEGYDIIICPLHYSISYNTNMLFFLLKDGEIVKTTSQYSEIVELFKEEITYSDYCSANPKYAIKFCYLYDHSSSDDRELLQYYEDENVTNTL